MFFGLMKKKLRKKKGGTTQLGKRFVCFAMNAKRIGKKKEIKKKALLK